MERGTGGEVLISPAPHSPLRELLAIALPLVLSAGFLTVQLCLDRIFLTWTGNDEAAASMPAVMLFSTLFGILQHTVQYTSVFVSQYIGAGRPERVGPVVWQSARLAVVGGFAFLLLIPLAGPLFELVGHAPEVATMEADYFRALCFAVPSAAVVAVVNAFFSGRGNTWTVFAVSGVGLAVRMRVGRTTASSRGLRSVVCWRKVASSAMSATSRCSRSVSCRTS